ncbi:MAG: SufD family Fe-S cluster assembly protein, partial [Thermoproteus sp.]|nr:SufD family Fe-S cluster assembly protein [Thermoproteus sp.]
AGDRGASYVRGKLVAGAGVALKLSPMATGGRANALHEEYVLAGPGATAEGVGLELGAGDSRIHHLISLINDGERTKSTVKLMAVSRDDAWVVQRALGRITKRGRWSESVVEGVAYIASKTAAAVTQPTLYIETGDVSGSRHSAADASLDEERAFYLRARGISEDELPTLVTLSLIDQYLSSIAEKLVDIVKQYIKI